MKPNWMGKPMSTWPLGKLTRDYRFAKTDLGVRHPWTRLLRLELIRRRDSRKK
jgi:hypothetical protein